MKEYDKEKSRHGEMCKMKKLHQSEMRCQSRQSHQIKETDHTTLVANNDNPIGMNRQEITVSRGKNSGFDKIYADKW